MGSGKLASRRLESRPLAQPHGSRYGRIIAGRLGNAGTPQEQQDQVHHLLRTWGYSVPASIEGRGCRLTIEIVSEGPGMLVIGLQPSGDDDVEAFRHE